MKGNCYECERRWVCNIDPNECDEWPDPLPMTNADRIRAMSDEELVDFIPNWSYTDACKCGEHYVDCNNECEKCVADWLQQPCGGADHE